MIPCEYFVGFDFLSILLHYNQPGKNSLQYWGIKLSWILKRWLLQFPRLRATTIPSIWWSRNFVTKFWQLFGAVLQLYPTVAYSSWPPKTTQFSGGSLFSSLTIYSLILCILICPLDFQVELVSLNFQNILYIGEFARGSGWFEVKGDFGPTLFGYPICGTCPWGFKSQSSLGPM